jgi:outer membrane protein assembly factor BamB
MALFVVLAPCQAADVSAWPQWRGAGQNGVATGEKYPIRWSEAAGIAWKIELPGRGGSTPVIQGSTAYMTAGVDGKNMLLAIDTGSGDLKWQAELGADRGGKHRKGSGSNPSPVIDGDLVYAYYRSGDLGCVDSKGEVKWTVNLQDKYGEDSLWWDLGSSPLLTDDAIVIVVMQTGPSYLAGFDKQSGDELWKVDRILDAPEEAAQSYTTPLAVKVGQQDAIAVMGADHLTLHRAADGKEIGRLGGFNPGGQKFFRSISSPVADGDFIICPYARGSTLTAVRMSELAAGKGSGAIAWLNEDTSSDVPTPAALDGRAYVVGDGKKNRGVVSCLDIESGKTLWTVAMEKSRVGFSSSPLIAGNHVYVTQENGTTSVIGPLSSEQPQIVSTNRIADTEPFTVASLVPVENDMLLRSRGHLYRIRGE